MLDAAVGSKQARDESENPGGHPCLSLNAQVPVWDIDKPF